MAASALAIPNMVVGYSFDVAPDLSSPEVRRKLTPGALRTFTNIVAAWKLTEAQARALLGGVASSTYHAWRTNPKGKQLDQDTLTRISLAIGIYKGLNIYFNKPLSDRWITLGNRGPLFAGASPVEYMIQNGLPGMVDVRRMIDAWRGGI
jgi:hypothetical protein